MPSAMAPAMIISAARSVLAVAAQRTTRVGAGVGFHNEPPVLQIFKRCGCRDPETGSKLNGSCPKLPRSDHGGWWFVHDVPPGPDSRRRRTTGGPFGTESDVNKALTTSLAEMRDGRRPEGADLTVGRYLDDWLDGKASLARSTRHSYEEHIRLYLRPGLGHLRLVDLRDFHIEKLYAAAMMIGREPKGRPSPLLTRLLEVRRDNPEHRRPLSATRLRRVHATLVSALNSAVKRRKLRYNPAEHVELPKARRVRPLVWTAPRVAAWQRNGTRPSPVMVWTPQQAGAFLDFAEADRLYPLWHLIAHRGLRCGEAAALGWTEIDFEDDSIYILDNLPGPSSSADDADIDIYEDPKSEGGHRTISLDETTRDVLAAWQNLQNEERAVYGTAWTDTGRVFTHPGGSELTPDGISQRFERLVARFATVRREHAEHGWSVEQLATRHRMPAEAIETALDFGPLPPIRLHDLRHTAASLTYRATRDLKIVSELLGHASVHFTGDVYTSVFSDADRAAAKAAAEIVPRRRPPGARPHAASPSQEDPSATQSEIDRPLPDGPELDL
ncbi:tyrosine recombinase XerC [Frankia sp. AvcI1]|uniref:site-specific integrase n=2 Tax=Frankia sp. AvcI1 TaxID=573496 RepID=UPI00211897B8|nr:site-specific integrase [Frankia sp. AvcI1]